MSKRQRDEPRRLFKNVNFTRIIVRALLILFFIGITFTLSYWRDEGTLGTGWIRNSLADIYAIFQYPALNIFYAIGLYTWTTYVIGLFINAYLWSVAIAIMLYILSKIFKTRDSFLLRPIGLLIIVAGIILIIISQREDFVKPLNAITVTNPIVTEHGLSKKTHLVFSGFITIVFGWIFISFSLDKKKVANAKDYSIR
jgi:hypothetical protein